MSMTSSCAVASSLRHEGLFEHYHDDLIAYLKNFALYGWDEKADRPAGESSRDIEKAIG